MTTNNKSTRRSQKFKRLEKNHYHYEILSSYKITHTRKCKLDETWLHKGRMFSSTVLFFREQTMQKTV